MFVIQKLLDDYHRRVEAWERARDKWVNDPKYADHYRSEHTYERNHPRPFHWVKGVFKGVMITVCLCLSTLLIVGFANEVAEKQKNKSKEETSQTDQRENKNCKYFNKNDYVRIQFGDYANINGRIIGGCEKGQDYQVKLDDNSWADVPNDGTQKAVDVGGRTISVNSYKNLVEVERDKK